MSESPFRHSEGGASSGEGGAESLMPRRPSSSILRAGSRTDLAALNEDDSGDESATMQRSIAKLSDVQGNRTSSSEMEETCLKMMLRNV